MPNELKLRILEHERDMLREEYKEILKIAQRLEKENEEVKNRKDDYYVKTLDQEAQISDLIQENEELKEAYEKEHDDYLVFKSNNMVLRQALEEIREILCRGRTFYDGYFDNDNLSRVDTVIKTINEVLR